MLKKRIIPLMLLSGDRLVKGVNFSSHRDVGNPVKSAKVYSDQDADELIILNINGHSGIKSLLNILPSLTRNVFMPLSLGGGIKTFEDAALLISNGADKVVINTGAYNTELISDISNRFGVQAVVVSIDVRLKYGKYILYSENGTVKQRIGLEEHVKSCIEKGAGELMIQCIDLDGSVSGFDENLAKKVLGICNIPVILASGCGNYSHIKSAFMNVDIAAVSCGSLFNFSDSSPIRAKSYLSNYGIKYKLL